MYTAKATQDGRWWMIEIEELDLLTQASSLSEVEAMAISAIATTLDVPESEVEVEVTT